MFSLLLFFACAPVSADLQTALDSAVAAGLPGASAAILTEGGLSVAHAGLAVRRPKEAWGDEHVFRVASNSKTVLGVVAAQLAAEGGLDLDLPLSTWLDEAVTGDIDNASEVTLRQCLDHTSGLYDEVLGAHHSTAFRSRVFDPLGMDRTTYEGEEAMGGALVHGYADYWGDGEDIDSATFDHGYGLADGGLLSTAAELAVFIEAVGSGEVLLDDAARSVMFDDATDAGGGERYGLGVSVVEDAHGTAVFHGGGLVGYTSEMTTWPDTGVSMVLLVNASDRDRYDDGFDALLEEVEALAHRGQ